MSKRAVAIMVALNAGAQAAQPQPRRHVNRCLGKWRGSAVAGYVFSGDEQTYKENFRCSRESFGLLHGLLVSSRFATAAETCTVWRTAQLAGGNKRIRSRRATAYKMTASRDPPTLRFKLAACMYVFGHGGPLKVLADSCGVGKSTLRGWLEQFSWATYEVLKPLYMPARPFTAEERAQVESEFAARRGIRNVVLACDGSHCPFRPKNHKVSQDYRCYKGWTSLLVVAFVDSFYRFYEVDVGFPGRAGDNTVLARSWLMNAIKQDRAKWLGEAGVILGDSGASDGDSVFMNPYHAPTCERRLHFNFCHSSTRFFIEQAFGIWKSRFRFILEPIRTGHKLTCLMLYASAVLHNFLLTHRRDHIEVDSSGPHWDKFFAAYKKDRCPSCVQAERMHCIHQSTNRNGAAQVVHARQAPSELREATCAYLWERVLESRDV